MQNSLTSVFPLDAVGGMTKLEYTSIELLAAHIKAHGRMPEVHQMFAVIDTASWLLDYAVPAEVRKMQPKKVVDNDADDDDHKPWPTFIDDNLEPNFTNPETLLP